VRYDVCYLEEPKESSGSSFVRTVRLGHRRSSRSLFTLARYLRDAKPRLALATPGHLSPFAVLAGRLAAVPVVPWEPTILKFYLPTAGWEVRILSYIQRLGYPGAPVVATVSKDVAVHFQERCIRPQRFYQLPNCVDKNEVTALAGERRSDDRRFRFCSVGTLTREKGVDVMLRAFGRANKDLPRTWELMLLGTGELRDELASLAEAEGISSHVHFRGYVENPYPILASAQVFVHSARWDGGPLAILEAAALGLPIVATNSPGGTREILTDEAGILVPPDDPDAFADALIVVASKKDLREELSLKAGQRADQYTPARIAERVLGLVAFLDARPNVPRKNLRS
jgi:glycosyltransferase involved in cell wall biosynthesis